LDDVLIDPPGISSVFIQSEDEKVSRNLLIKKNVKKIIQVLDANNMSRSLALALQIAEFGIPMVFAVNMDDTAQSKGITIDTEKLSVLFGVKVSRTVARENHGIPNLKDSLQYCSIPKSLMKFPSDIEEKLQQLAELFQDQDFSPRGMALLLLNHDSSVEKIIAEKAGPEVLEKCRDIIKSQVKTRRKGIGLILTEIFIYHANRLTAEFVHREEQKKTPFLTALGRYSTRLSVGIPLAGLVAIMMYFFVGKIGAEFLVGIFEGRLFGEFIIPLVGKWLSPLGSEWITDFFCGDFGVVSVGLGLAFGVLLPVLLTFYLFFGFLEDSGYLPRLSILLDKLFRKMGMNGKGVMPLIMGFSCITMAILTARMLDTKKEKIIITMLLLLGIPCAPLLSVMFVIFAKLHWSAILVVFGIIIVKILVAGVVANKIVPGERGDFIIEVPPFRMPDIKLLARRACLRLFYFMKEAVPIFLLASVVLFVFEKLKGLDALRAALYPAVKLLLGLPEQSVEVLVMTIVRREAGAALLDQLFGRGIFNGLQAVVILVVMISLLPCVNAIIVLFKERELKTAAIIIGIIMPTAILVGTLVNYSCMFAGITF
jgi:ferrous iron transport protein B